MAKQLWLSILACFTASFLCISLGRRERLSGSQVPLEYRLHFNALNSDILTGNTSIKFLNQGASYSLTLHAVDLSLTNISVEEAETHRKVEVTNIGAEDSLEDEVAIFFSQSLRPGTIYLVNITYSTKLCGRRYILCPASSGQNVTEPNDTPLMSAVTLTAPLGSRTIYPCFDEPSYKAPFRISISHRRGTVALSNGRVLTTTSSGQDIVTTSFEQTPPLPTYLMTFAVGNFAAICNNVTTKHGVEVCIYSPPINISETILKKSLDIYTQFLTKFTDQFQIPYLMSKLDLVVPNSDMLFGAMENPGIILHHKDYLANGILEAHELSHQWFGNRVTVKWWCDIFIQEGIAEYFGYQIQDKESIMDMALYSLHYWMKMERNFPASLKTLRCPVEDPKNMTHIRDMWMTSIPVIYYKGLGVVNMIADMLGEKEFVRSLINYVRKHDGENASLKDFLDHLSTDFGNSRIEQFEEWFSQPGFPEVHVIAETGGTLHACQKKADRLNREDNATFNLDYFQQQNGTIWQIPMVYIISSNQTSSGYLWLRQRCMKLPIEAHPSPDNNEWYFINPDRVYPYKVNYDLQNWNNLLAVHGNVSQSINMRLSLEQEYFQPPVSTDLLNAFKAVRGMLVVNAVEKFQKLSPEAKKLVEANGRNESVRFHDSTV